MEPLYRIFTHFPIQPQRIYSGEKGINVIVYPPTETGPIDWALKMGDTIISVTEAKREDINQGVAQSTVQAHASLQCNRKKHTYDDADLYEGVDWVITKVQSGIGDGNYNGDGKVEVFLCSPTPTPPYDKCGVEGTKRATESTSA